MILANTLLTIILTPLTLFSFGVDEKQYISTEYLREVVFRLLNLRGRGMLQRRNFSVDRRSGEDRRRVYDLDYFSNGGVERRSWKERRSHVERRVGWLRVNKWVSVYVKDFRSKSA